MGRFSAALAAVVLTVGLAGCGADGSSTDPLEVEVGEEFTWNDFTVEDGWTLSPIERSVGVNDTVVSPEVKGSVVNNSAEERAPIFEMVFSSDGDALATINCSAMKLLEGQTGSLLCPGLGAEMPLDYDSVVVRQLVRD